MFVDTILLSKVDMKFVNHRAIKVKLSVYWKPVSNTYICLFVPEH